MFSSLFVSKWQRSQAHLLLLSKFVHPHTVEDYENLSMFSWKQVLGEAPSKAVNRFISEGMLTYADTPKSLEWKYKIPDLKKMLKERMLPMSGNKSELTLRLVGSDPNGMKELVFGLNVLVCSEQGRQIADDYLASEKQKRHDLEQQVLNALRNRKFKKAILLRSSFEAEQVFPVAMLGTGHDWRNPGANRSYWRNYNPAQDIPLLEIIFASNPRILRNFKLECLEHLRLAAGMMYLLGEDAAKGVLPGNLKTGLVMNGVTAARMVTFHARNQVHLAECREVGAESVEVSTANDGATCEACKKIEGKKFKIDEVIELPMKNAHVQAVVAVQFFQ